MIKLYLVTGFLGAGKTTLLKNIIKQLSGIRLRIIVNEFGREGIDGALLRQTGAEVEEITNGSIFCSCRLDKFEDTLRSVCSQSPEVIFVEASGLSDPTHIERVLSRLGGPQELEYMGGICLVDAVGFKKVLPMARVSRRQVAVCDLALLNKSDLATEESLSETEELIRQINPYAIIHRTVYSNFEQSWLEGLGRVRNTDSGSSFHLKDVSLLKLRIVLRNGATLDRLEKFLSMFIEDTYRIKGVAVLDTGFTLVDCVGVRLNVLPFTGECDNLNILVAMSGAGMPMEQSVRQAAQWYPDLVDRVEWDE